MNLLSHESARTLVCLALATGIGWSQDRRRPSTGKSPINPARSSTATVTARIWIEHELADQDQRRRIL